MNCESCGDDSKEFVVLPGRLENKIVCLSCAEKSPAYCKKHKRPHLGFEDGSTACILCIEEMVEDKKKEGVNVWGELCERIPAMELARLLDWAELTSSLKGETKERAMLRAVITKALRTDQPTKAVIRELIEKQSVSPILPFYF